MKKIIQIRKIVLKKLHEQTQYAVMKQPLILNYLIQHDQMNWTVVRVEFEIARIQYDQLDPFDYANRDNWIPD